MTRSTPSVIPLDGEWEVREALGDTWEWYVRARIEARNNAAEVAGALSRAPGWLPAAVPGSVITALVAAGEIPEPRRGRNSRAAEWTADRSWVYRRAVEVPPTQPGESIVLELDGVDPAARVFWDGAPVGAVSGLFRAARMPVPAEPGSHTLAVVVAPVPVSEPQVGRTERVRIHAPRMNYGWDFCPRFPHQGIWKSVRLRIAREPLGAVSVRTELNGDSGRVLVTADREVSTEVLFDGEVVASGGAEVDVPSAHLWWPAGLGRQLLYAVRIRTADDERTFHVGFRTVEFVRNPGGPDSALPYSALVNGVPVPLVGWNWTPADAQYEQASGPRLAHLLALAVESGARILRVWGGGLIETEEFYRRCDEAGLLVWQEFSQSSSGAQSAPATDDEFVRHLRDEAEALVPTLGHHPSLVIWGGGNELDEDGVPLDEERSPALAALRDTVRRLDPGRHWLPTSPSGPAFHNRLDILEARPDDQHDVHGPWEHQGLVAHYTLYNAGRSLAHTEFGVEGMTNRRALDALVPAEQQDPPDRTNPVYRHLGDWWNNADLVRASFGGRLETVEQVRRASQWLQATGLGYAVEADRRRSPRCSMVLPWQLDESFPNAWCTSAVDFLGEPKPAFWAVTRAFARDRVTLRTGALAWSGGTPTTEAWLWSEAGRGPGHVVLRARDLDGRVLGEASWAVDGVAEPAAVGSLAVDAAGVFLWDAEWRDEGGELVDRETVVATEEADLAALVDLPLAEVEIAAGAAAITIRHVSGPAVIGLILADARDVTDAGFVAPGGDPRPLLPGESRSLPVRARDGVPWLVRVEAWNLEPALVGFPG